MNGDGRAKPKPLQRISAATPLVLPSASSQSEQPSSSSHLDRAGADEGVPRAAWTGDTVQHADDDVHGQRVGQHLAYISTSRFYSVLHAASTRPQHQHHIDGILCPSLHPPDALHALRSRVKPSPLAPDTASACEPCRIAYRRSVLRIPHTLAALVAHKHCRRRIMPLTCRHASMHTFSYHKPQLCNLASRYR